MSRRYEVTVTPNRVEAVIKRPIWQHQIINELEMDELIPGVIATQLKKDYPDAKRAPGETFTIDFGGLAPSLPSMIREERSNKAMAKRLMDTLVKQYAPDADTAWDWMRKAHEMGWEWSNHMLGGPSASDPLGQRVNKSVATAFSNGAGIYVGICLVAGAVRWGWFRAEEWGPRGRDLVLSGNRNFHPDPIAAIADYALMGEATPAPKLPLDDVFGGQWDD